MPGETMPGDRTNVCDPTLPDTIIGICMYVKPELQ